MEEEYRKKRDAVDLSNLITKFQSRETLTHHL